MAKTKWWVVWDIQNDGAGYQGIAAKEKFQKGETLGPEELGSTKLVGTVFAGKLVQVEAEGEEEAAKIAGEAYGSRGGVAGVPHAEKELKFFSV